LILRRDFSTEYKNAAVMALLPISQWYWGEIF
jgi:hypothetical protein